MKRHELIFVSPFAWRAHIATRDDLNGNPLVAVWVDKGWPLIGRRPLPGDGPGVALGLPLPPFASKRRLAFVMQPEDIVSTAPPPALRAAIRAAPLAWWPTLLSIGDLASRHSMEARVYGSLAWRAVTGLDYLTDRSDLDLLLQVHGNTDLRQLAADLARIEAAAPMRIDGEFVRPDGVAVHWREFHGEAREILVKTGRGVALVDTSRFLPWRMHS